MAATPVATVADEAIRPGDVVMFLGTPHPIVAVEPYAHPTVDGAIGIARAADGWGISLWRGGSQDVAGGRR